MQVAPPIKKPAEQTVDMLVRIMPKNIGYKIKVRKEEKHTVVELIHPKNCFG